MKTLFYLFSFLFLISCKKEVKKPIEVNSFPTKNQIDSVFEQPETIKTKSNNSETSFIKDTSFVNILSISSDFVLDLKYATTDNFLKEKVYECADCYLRINTAKALHNANQDFQKLGYRIKLFDCYRPIDIQKKMWKILPGTHYVANPKKGSKHNRGAAVDLTLVDSNGNELNMGTPFDFFGKEAHHTYYNHPKEVLENRKLLKETLEKHNFKSIYSEWWHYEYRPEIKSPVSNFKWKCE